MAQGNFPFTSVRSWKWRDEDGSKNSTHQSCLLKNPVLSWVFLHKWSHPRDRYYRSGVEINFTKPTPRKSATRRIQAQANQNHLLIQNRVGRLSLNNLIQFGEKLLLSFTSLLLLIAPITIGILAISSVVFARLLGHLKLSALFLVILLIFFFLGSAKKTVKELKRVQDDINQARLASFGLQSLPFYKKSNPIIFEQPLWNIDLNEVLLIFNNERYSSCQISDIPSIEAIPFEGIVIQSNNQRYVLGQKLSDTEYEWLTKKIKDWLSARSMRKEMRVKVALFNGLDCRLISILGYLTLDVRMSRRANTG